MRTTPAKRVAATITIAAIATIGTHPMVSANQNTQIRGSATPTWTVQVTDAQGRFVDLMSPVPTRSLSQGPTKSPKATKVDLDKLRNELLTLKLHPRFAARADRALKVLEILRTTDRTQRRALIVELGVRVATAPAGDGREGTVKTFSLAGRAKARLFIPTSATHASATEPPRDEVSRGGPSVFNGRWKEDGEGVGGCYWDATDSGPDQCAPATGRWKVGAECYWDPNDSGPNQCEPDAPPPVGDGPLVCYFEGNPDDCASVEDGEDAMALAVALEADEASLQADYAAAEAYCNLYGCTEDMLRSGPSDDNSPNCASQLVDTAVKVGEFVWSRYRLYATAARIAAGAIVSAGSLALVVVTTTVGLVAAAFTAVELYRCLYPTEPALKPFDQAVEAVLASHSTLVTAAMYRRRLSDIFLAGSTRYLLVRAPVRAAVL